jgi:hypothetical protein
VTISKQGTDEEVLDREVRLPPVNGQKNPLRPINVPNNIKESGWYRLSVDIGGKSESTDIYLRDDGFPSFTMGTVYVKPNGEPKVQSATA